MGINGINLHNSGNYDQRTNPNPTRWDLVRSHNFSNAYVLEVKYLDCSNFEGKKILVFRGKQPKTLPNHLDPHFEDSPDSPIARFKPDDNGWKLACEFARLR